MRRYFLLTVLSVVAVLFFVAGCDNDISGFRPDDMTLSFTTINAKMGEDLPFKELREEKLLELIRKVDSDVVCIQEIYDRTLMKKIIDAVSDDENEEKYIFSYNNRANTSNDDFDSLPAPCSERDLAPILLCVMTNCMDEGLDPMCVVTNCWSEFLALPETCRNCMLSEGLGSITGEGDITAIFTGCMSAQKIEYRYSGNNGILLLSKYPLKDKSFETLTASGVVRGAVFATIGRMEREVSGETKVYEPKPGIGDVQVICTGLSRPVEGFEGDLQSEQLTQVREIIDLPVEESVVQRVVMGDFNGNVSGGINMTERNPGPVSLMLNEGWYDPYFDVHRDDVIPCIVCPENPLVDDNETGFVPEHIFFSRKKGFSFSAGRVLLNEFVHLDHDAKMKYRYSISDHYAVSAKMTVSR
jgi:endonuclease/exonuclease/phosphatase family metal-dependent hydrolase